MQTIGPTGHKSVAGRRLGRSSLRLDRVVAGRGAARTLASIAVVPTIGLVLVLTALATLAIATGMDHGEPAVTTMPAMDHVATE